MYMWQLALAFLVYDVFATEAIVHMHASYPGPCANNCTCLKLQLGLSRAASTTCLILSTDHASPIFVGNWQNLIVRGMTNNTLGRAPRIGPIATAPKAQIVNVEGVEVVAQPMHQNSYAVNISGGRVSMAFCLVRGILITNGDVVVYASNVSSVWSTPSRGFHVQGASWIVRVLLHTRPNPIANSDQMLSQVGA